MSERKTESQVLIKIGKLIESKRKALGKQYNSREKFIDNRSDELFGSEDWISLRYLYNIERGKNWISIEKLLLLSKALEVDPVDLFAEITAICLSDRSYSQALVGVPPSPRLTALRPVKHACRRGSMLRMTSREKVTQQRHGDSRRAAQGACPLYGAKRCKLPGAVTSQRSRQRPRRAHRYIAAGYV